MKIFLITAFACGITIAQTKTGTTATKSPTKASPTRNILDPSTLKARAPETFKAKFVTTQGEIVLQITRAWAPLGADRFYNLVRGGFFTNCYFYRVIPGFMAQFGYGARPDVNQAWENAKIQDDAVKEHNTRGKITFAKTGAPNSRTTQFFINYGDNSRLDSDGFAPFGEVTEGMEVVEKFFSGEADQDKIRTQGKGYIDRAMPKTDYIKSASIVPAAPAAPKQPAELKDQAKD